MIMNQRTSRRTLLGGTAALAVAASGLTACTSGGKPKAPATALESMAPSVTAAPEVTGISYPDGYVGPRARTISPIVTEPASFTVLVPQDARVGDWSKNYFSKWYQEQTGIEITFRQVAGGEDMMTKVNAMIAAGDVPDAFLGIPFSRSQLLQYGEQGMFAPLRSLIGGYALNLQQAMKDYPDSYKLIRSPNDEIYAFPDYNDGKHARASEARAFINTDWLERLGLEEPTTTTAFQEVLREFKKADLGGGGRTIPFAAYAEASLDKYFMNSFLYHPGGLGLVVNGGTVETTVNKPEYREGLKYIKGLIDEGLINNDAVTATADQMLRRGNQPGNTIMGGARAYYWGLFVDIDQKDPEARWRQYRTLAPLEGPNKVRYSPWDYYTIGVETPTFVISGACERPELLVQWADLQYDLEVSLHANLGKKGERWEWAPEGVKGINGKDALYYFPGGWNEKPADATSGWSLFSVSYRSEDYRLAEGVVEGNETFEKPLYEQTVEYNEPYKQPIEMQFPPVTLTEADAAEDAEISTNLQNEVSVALAKFSTGKLDPNDDAAWQDYVERLDRIGLGRMLESRQAAYEQFMA
ncbi:extracellular solute-binding protein [Microlunatus sp. GCM10028923]|uniref:extracellular solute-binding protein n=1 Tax=Microlunatus sp. GCM10028923 TaxID=3273400 RepID=UPI0036123AF2